MESQTLQGRSIVVTGGGTGIGAACARVIAQEGASVTICGRRERPLEAIVEAVRATGGRIQGVVADVTVEDDVAKLLDAAAEFGEGLHGVIANAGGGGNLAPYHLQELEEFERVIRLNVIGTVLSVKHAVPHLVRSGGGSFIGMSSIAGRVTHRYFGAYPVAKASIESIIKNAADEYGEHKVRFNAIQPGFIATEVMAGIDRAGPVWHSYVEQTPLTGVGTPNDIAQIAVSSIGRVGLDHRSDVCS